MQQDYNAPSPTIRRIILAQVLSTLLASPWAWAEPDLSPRFRLLSAEAEQEQNTQSASTEEEEQSAVTLSSWLNPEQSLTHIDPDAPTLVEGIQWLSGEGPETTNEASEGEEAQPAPLAERSVTDEPEQAETADATTEDDAEQSEEESSKYTWLKPSKQKLLQQANTLLGVPYVAGGTSPKGFDCSGFVYYNTKLIGIEVPRTAAAQASVTSPINRTQLQPGDLVFFKINRRSKNISHVGIYLGNNRFIHAPSRNKKVTIANLNDRYWNKRFVRGGRLPA